MPRPHCALILALTVLPASPSLGDTTIGSLNTAGFSPSAGHDFLGEQFIVPAGETGLVSAALMLHNSSPAIASGVLSIREFDSTTADPAAGAFGATIASQPFLLGTAGGPILTSWTFNVPVVPGNEYAVVADWGVGGGAQVGGYFNSGYTPAGFTLFEGDPSGSPGAGGAPILFQGFDLAFEVTFGTIPEPASLALLAPAAVLALSRRRRSATAL